MTDKIYFQFVAIIALVVLIVFLFWDSTKTTEIAISGAIFVLATILSLFVGRSDGGTDRS